MKYLIFLLISLFLVLSCKNRNLPKCFLTLVSEDSLLSWYVGENLVAQKELLDMVNDNCASSKSDLTPDCDLEKILPKLDRYQYFYAPLKKGLIYSEKKYRSKYCVIKKSVPNNLHLYLGDHYDLEGSVLAMLYTYNIENDLQDSLILYKYYMNEELVFYSQRLYYIDNHLNITTADLYVGEEGYAVKSYNKYQIDSLTGKLQKYL